MVVDGIGEFGSMAFYRYVDGKIETVKRHRGPESLGFLYGLVTIQPVLKAHVGLGFTRGPDLHIYAFPLAAGQYGFGGHGPLKLLGPHGHFGNASVVRELHAHPAAGNV